MAEWHVHSLCFLFLSVLPHSPLLSNGLKRDVRLNPTHDGGGTEVLSTLLA